MTIPVSARLSLTQTHYGEFNTNWMVPGNPYKQVENTWLTGMKVHPMSMSSIQFSPKASFLCDIANFLAVSSFPPPSPRYPFCPCQSTLLDALCLQKSLHPFFQSDILSVCPLSQYLIKLCCIILCMYMFTSSMLFFMLSAPQDVCPSFLTLVTLAGGCSCWPCEKPCKPCKCRYVHTLYRDQNIQITLFTQLIIQIKAL